MGWGYGVTPRECQAMIPRLCAYTGITTRGHDAREPWSDVHVPRLHVVPAIRLPHANQFYFETNDNFLNEGEYGGLDVSACRPVAWFMATRPFALMNRANIEQADRIIYVSTWKHVYPPLALPVELPQERAFYDSDRATFDGRRNWEYARTWRLVRDDSIDTGSQSDACLS